VPRVLKRVGWIAASVALVPIVGYLALLAFNWKDRPPSSAAVQLREAVSNRIAVVDGDNAYVFMMGFAAAQNADPHVIGSMRTAWAKKIAAGSASDQDPAQPVIDLSTSRSRAIIELAEQCQRADAECENALHEQQSTLHVWLVDEAWLLRRYLSLLEYTAWQEPSPFDLRVPLPSYTTVFEAQKLMHAHARELATQGQFDAVRELLARDIRFWRLTLRSADVLITKLTAAAALRRHFEFGNLIMRSVPPESIAVTVPAEWRDEISMSEKSLLRSLAGEWLFLDRYVHEAKLEPATDAEDRKRNIVRRALNPLLQPQDSSNSAADRLVVLAKQLDVPYAQFTSALNKVRAKLRADVEAQAPLALYNTLGSLLAFTAPADYTAYAARVADLEGIRRAALLAATLRAEGVEESQLTSRLDASQIRDPYNEKPFEWDERAHAIVFTGLENSERGRHAMLY
jgi:type III secretion system FlhB-like substrate exporter